MMQVITSPRTITRFGGINLIYNTLKRMGQSEFIDEKMGSRSIFAHYKYSDIVFPLLGNNLTLGNFLVDIEIFKQKIAGQHYAPVSSGTSSAGFCLSTASFCARSVFQRSDV